MTFFLFFLQSTILTLIGPLFRNNPETPWGQVWPRQLSPKGPPLIFYFFKLTYKTGRNKESPFRFFFRHCASVFSKLFLLSPKGPLRFEFFEILTECMLINPKRSPFLHFSALCDIFKFQKMFCVFWALDIAPTLNVLVLFLFLSGMLNIPRYRNLRS